jgi:lysophospholipase L1-like esterase
MESFTQISPKRVAKITAIGTSIVILISLVYPREGITLFGKTFYFINAQDVIQNQNNTLNVEELMANRLDSLDNEFSRLEHLSNEMKAQRALEIANADSSRIFFPTAERDALDAFFESLHNIPETQEQVRIIHFGDSQIEEDRISSYLRREFQAKFGGGGLGIVSARPIGGSMSASHSYSNNWKRYTAFSLTGEPLSNRRYGAYGITCKYMGNTSDKNFPELQEENIEVAEGVEAQEAEPFEFQDKNKGYVTIRPSDKNNSNLFKFDQVRVFLGNVEENIKLNVVTDQGQFQENISAGLDYKGFNFSFTNSPSNVSVTFSGGASPEIYGISLESSTGVVLDNIAMRGSDGSVFVKFHQTLAKSMFSDLNPKLIILQFGGNAMPVISSRKVAQSYGKQLTNSIKFLRKYCPNASFLFIGPADMCKTVNGQLQTYPMMETTIEELKNVCKENNVAFFNMYQMMGGKNSMIQWVKEGLAVSDYIHFNRRGAEKMSEILYKYLMLEYELYLIKTQKSI